MSKPVAEVTYPDIRKPPPGERPAVRFNLFGSVVDTLGRVLSTVVSVLDTLVASASVLNSLVSVLDTPRHPKTSTGGAPSGQIPHPNTLNPKYEILHPNTGVPRS